MSFTNQIVPSESGLALLASQLGTTGFSTSTTVLAFTDPAADVSIYQSLLITMKTVNGNAIADAANNVADVALTWHDAAGNFLNFDIIQIPTCGGGTRITFRIPVKGATVNVAWRYYGTNFGGPVDIQVFGSYRPVEETSMIFSANTGSPNLVGQNGDRAIYADISAYAASQAKDAWSAPWIGRAQLIFRSSGAGSATVSLQYYSSLNNAILTFYQETITGAGTQIIRDIVFPGGPVFVTVTNDATAKTLVLWIAGG